MLAPPSPPAKCRRLGLAPGSSKSRVVPRSPSRVAAALGSTACSRGSRSPAGDLVQVAQDSALSHPACRAWRPGKVCCGRRAARPWDFHSCARPPPQRVAMDTAGSWWWKTDPAQSKILWVQLGWLQGGRGPEGMSGSQRQRPTTKGRVRGERSSHGASLPLCESRPSCFPEAPRSLISLQQLHLFSSRLRPHPATPPPRGSCPASLPVPRLGASWAVCPPPPRATGSPTWRFWHFFPRTRGSPQMNFSAPLLKRYLKQWGVRIMREREKQEVPGQKFWKTRTGSKEKILWIFFFTPCAVGKAPGYNSDWSTLVKSLSLSKINFNCL